METMVPKLVAEDIPLLNSLLSDVFPGVQYTPSERERLRKEIRQICAERYLMYGEGEELGGAWVDKVRVYVALIGLYFRFFSALLSGVDA